MLNFSQLQTFVTVVSEGSMTAAADKLFLTQPAVSQQMKNLEDELDVELIVRGSKQIKTTAQGELLYEFAKKILSLVQQTEISIKSVGAQLKGLLRIGTLNSIGLHLMSPIVNRLLKYNPDFKIKIEYAKGEDIIRQFENNELDVIVLPETQMNILRNSMDFHSEVFMKEEVWLVGPGKDEFYPATMPIKELKKIPYVHFMNEYPDFDAKLKQVAADLPAIFESSNVGTLKRVIESGLGVGFLPAHSVKKQIRGGRLNRIQITDFNYDLKILYGFKKNNPHSQTAEILFQALMGDQQRT
jgi:DNA-binding transcriptional LysR family regulator